MPHYTSSTISRKGNFKLTDMLSATAISQVSISTLVAAPPGIHNAPRIFTAQYCQPPLIALRLFSVINRDMSQVWSDSQTAVTPPPPNSQNVVCHWYGTHARTTSLPPASQILYKIHIQQQISHARQKCQHLNTQNIKMLCTSCTS
jgi:hypothetical protein